MKKLISSITSPGAIGYNGILLFLRVFFGVLMMTHGLAKLNHFDQMAGSFLDPIGWGSEMSLAMVIFAELGCSILLIFGFFTRLAAIPPLFSMCIAIFVAHAADPLSAKEMAVMYAGIYVVLLFLGGGAWSVDALIYRKCSKAI